MLRLRGLALSLAGLVVLTASGTASAGWQSVFQVCCHNCSTPSATSAFFSQSAFETTAASVGSCCQQPCPCPQTCCQPVCCNPCPQVVATTNYVQRTFYQPVTTMVTKTYYEPCTTYRTSYYYEPVTCMRYTCCFDPCTCCWKKVATPVTSYRLRSQCCPVTSYVQRCCQVPVTTYQKSCYWEAQTCYSLVDPCTGRTISNGTTAPAASSPGVSETPSGGSLPGVNERPAVPAPSDSGSPLFNSQPPANAPEGSNSSLRRGSQKPPAYVQPQQPKAPVVPKYDRIAFDSAPANSNQWNLAGQVVNEQGSKPRANARLLFVSEAASGQQQSASTDAQGKFKVSLASGNWLVYLRDENGKAVFQSRVNVKNNESQQMTLVSR
jgi:hypothetical protein